MTKPTQNLTWDSNGTNLTTPRSGWRSDGFATNDIPTSGEDNYLRKGYAAWQAYLDAQNDTNVSNINTADGRINFNQYDATVTPFEANDFYAISYNSGGGFYLVTGSAGVTYRSVDAGLTWVKQVVGAGDFLCNASNGTTTVIADTNGAIWNTTDGLTFTSRTPGYSTAAYAIAYGGGAYIIGSATGNYQTSVDGGTTWVWQDGPFAADIRSIAVGAAYFALGLSNGKTIYVAQNLGVLGSPSVTASAQGIYNIAYKPGFGFIAYGHGGKISTSIDDGLTWSYDVATLSDTGYPVGSVVNEYGIVGLISDSNNIFWTSDGLNFTKQPTKLLTSFYGSSQAAYLNGLYFLLGFTGQILRCDTYTSIRNDLQTALVTNKNAALAASQSASAMSMLHSILQSVNSAQAPGNTVGAQNTVSFANPTGGYSVASIGASNNIFFSTPTNTYNIGGTLPALTGTQTGSAHTFYDICCDGTTYLVACGAAGIIYTMPIASGPATLTAATSGTANALTAIATDGVNYCAVSGTTSTSTMRYKGSTLPTGTWSGATTGLTSKALVGVAYGNGVWVSISSDGIPITASTPGGTWTTQTTLASFTCQGMKFIGGLFVAYGNAGKIFTSTNGVTWSAKVDPSVNAALGTLVGATAIPLSTGGYLYLFNAFYSSQFWIVYTYDSFSTMKSSALSNFSWQSALFNYVPLAKCMVFEELTTSKIFISPQLVF